MEGAAFAEHVGDDYRDGVRRVCRGVVQRRAAAIVVRDVIEQYARVIIASIAFSFVRSFVRSFLRKIVVMVGIHQVGEALYISG